MKVFTVIALIGFVIGNSIINKKYVEVLKKSAKFEVYEPEENPFRDWTNEEIRGMLGAKIPVYGPREYDIKINADYDFRKNYPECMLGIRDQQQCGACWAFSGVTTLQERFCLKSKGAQNKLLSAQDPVSCDDGNLACTGGYLDALWRYLRRYGVVEETCFPYSAGQGQVEECINQCKNGDPWKKYHAKTISNFFNPQFIMQEIPINGPVQASFNVYDDFLNYKGGIYIHNSGTLQGGHAIVIVGYGSENGVNFWICQNSWGPNWGESGYFRIKFGEVGIDSNCYAGDPEL